MGVKKQSLHQFFLKYTVQICVNTVLIVGLMVLLAALSGVSGLILPANYAEVTLKKDSGKLSEISHISEEMIPPHCIYGVYEEDGRWLYGNFPEEIREKSWENFTTDTKFSPDGKYFFFRERERRSLYCKICAEGVFFRGSSCLKQNRTGKYAASYFSCALFDPGDCFLPDFLKKTEAPSSCAQSGNRKNRE